MTCSDWWFKVVEQTYSTTELMTLGPSELQSAMTQASNLLYHDIFSTLQGWTVKEDVHYTLSKLREWRDQGSGPRIGVISNFDDRLVAILKELGLLEYFDFVLTSHEAKSEKPSRDIFDQALKHANLPNTACSSAYHIGNSLTSDVSGAINAGWHALHYKEFFDEGFPDWSETDTIKNAQAGFERRRELMQWGRKDVVTNVEWTELWGLDDALHMFGFPDDPNKPIPTTLLRGFLTDE
jgi:REG-2-like HAD superfamily hydrolase